MSGNELMARLAPLVSEPLEHEGVRVVTLRQVDELHGRNAGVARSAFRRLRQKNRVVEGKHYFRLPRTTVSKEHGGAGEAVVALTERGYLLLVKAFNDDLSWDVQEHLVDVYFRSVDAVRALVERVRYLEQSNLEALACIDEARRALGNAALMAKRGTSLAAATLALAGHDKAPGPKQTKRAGRHMHTWREEPGLREAALAALQERPQQALIPGVSYALLTAGNNDALAGLLERLASAAVEKAMAARSAGVTT